MARYLKQVVSETLRCAVVAPYAARYQDVDTVLGGHRIPAGVSAIGHRVSTVSMRPVSASLLHSSAWIFRFRQLPWLHLHPLI